MRMRTIAGLILVAGILWLRRGDDGAPAHPHRLQAAVLSDGFAVLIGPRDVHDSRRVIELDRDGAKQDEMPLRLEREVRLVGTRSGAAVGWQDGKKLKFGSLDSDGNPDDISTWGKNVRQLCDGAASNEHRFAVGWLESDGRVWFVHGPMARIAALDAIVADAGPAKATWCGIASAEQNVALLWREGSRLLMNFCTRKRCTDIVVKVPVGSNDALLGYGCVRDSCLFATRDKHGTTKLLRVTAEGRAIVRTLENATTETPVSIVGAGTRAFAIAYMAKDGLATINRVTVDGAFANVWHFENTRHVPTLAWAGDRLLCALQSEHAGYADYHVLKLPR